MKKIIAYEMSFTKEIECSDEKLCIPFQQKYWNEYKQKYNECFYEMRKDLEVEPINFYSSYSQMIDKASNTYLYFEVLHGLFFEILTICIWRGRIIAIYIIA
jgi:hypothetical protein